MKSTFTVKLGHTICERIALGEPLTTICKSIKNAKGQSLTVNSVYRWLDCEKNEDYINFKKAYARARETQAHSIYSEIQDIERRMTLPRKIKDARGKEILNPDYIDPNAGRVLIDAKKWRAAKMRPKTYGDKVDLGVTGDVNVTVVDSFK